MKASKKALTNNITKKAEDDKIKKAYVQDMAKTEDQLALIAQKTKYLKWLEEKCKKTDSSTFFTSMLNKLGSDYKLTANMEIALDKCMTPREERKPIDIKDAKPIKLKMRQWWTKANNLDSRVVSGVVLAESAKAYHVKGHADMIDGTWCMRCGRELTEPASMLIGFGSDCCDKLGIEYPTNILTATKKERTAIRKKLLKVLVAQEFTLWIPKSQIEEEY